MYAASPAEVPELQDGRVRIQSMLSSATQLRRIARRLAHAPMFTVVTLLTLGIGIGANTAIFSVIRTVLLKPLPFHEPDRLVGVWHSASGLGFKTLNVSPANYFTYKEEGRAFEGIGLYNQDSVTVTGLAEPEQVRVLRVNYDLFPVLRVQPALGRAFSSKDDSPGSPETAILTHSYWQQKFGGDRAVLGRRLLVDGRPVDIIGVMGEQFRFLDLSPGLLLPMRFDRAKVFVGNFSFEGVARLKPGVTLAQANSDVSRMLPMMLNKFRLPPGFSLKMLEQAKIEANLHPLHEDLVGDIGTVLWVLMGTVGIVLLIACANVANLFLVRAEGRRQELAIRAALGAGRGQVAKELLLESVSLGLLGGVIGLALAYGGIQLLKKLRPIGLPRLEDISLDPYVLTFAAGVSLFAGLLFGVIPVFKYAGAQLGSRLKQGGRNASDGRERNRARGVLVVVQIALALVLLISSGLMIRTFQALRNVQPGFIHPQQVVTLRISIPEAQAPNDEQAVRTHEQIIRRLERLPGIISVGLSSGITMDGNHSNDPVFVEERPTPEGQIAALRRMKWISPAYFKTMGTALMAGRDLTWADVYNKAPVAMVSDNFAKAQFGTPSGAVGKRIRETPKNPWREIVGVVSDVRDNGVNQPAPEMVYWPMMMANFWDEAVHARRSIAYAIRSPRVGSAEFMNEVRQAIWSVNPNLPLASVRTLQEIHQRSMARTSFTLVMLGMAGAMALLLGVVGIYGVIAYSVSQRTREIGIRMALGAQREDVRAMFVRHALMLTGIGITIGLAAAIALTRLMSTLLYGVSAADPITYTAVSVALISATLLASYLPARRATGIDPVQALRSE